MICLFHVYIEPKTNEIFLCHIDLFPSVEPAELTCYMLFLSILLVILTKSLDHALDIPRTVCGAQWLLLIN